MNAKTTSIVRIIAILGMIAIVLGALLPALSAIPS
jgi:hypothetical protein